MRVFKNKLFSYPYKKVHKKHFKKSGKKKPIEYSQYVKEVELMLRDKCLNEKNYEMPESLQCYLRDIGITPLLTPKEEIALAKRIQKGDADAKEHMIRANLRLVVKIAADYMHFGLPLIELISEGNIGLIKAVERFNPTRGAKFSTYAAWWIKQCIRRGIAHHSKTIRIPMHMVDKLQKLRRLHYQLSHELGREPTDKEVADEMGTSAARIHALRQNIMHGISLDDDIFPKNGNSNSNSGTTLSEIIKDDRITDPGTSLENRDMNTTISDSLKILDPREMKILALRFGLKGYRRHTLEEVGRQLKVTRERIRQLQNSALKKIKKSVLKKDRRRFIRKGVPLSVLATTSN